MFCVYESFSALPQMSKVARMSMVIVKMFKLVRLFMVVSKL